MPRRSFLDRTVPPDVLCQPTTRVTVDALSNGRSWVTVTTKLWNGGAKAAEGLRTTTSVQTSGYDYVLCDNGGAVLTKVHVKRVSRRPAPSLADDPIAVCVGVPLVLRVAAPVIGPITVSLGLVAIVESRVEVAAIAPTTATAA